MAEHQQKGAPSTSRKENKVTTKLTKTHFDTMAKAMDIATSLQTKSVNLITTLDAKKCRTFNTRLSAVEWVVEKVLEEAMEGVKDGY